MGLSYRAQAEAYWHACMSDVTAISCVLPELYMKSIAFLMVLITAAFPVVAEVVTETALYHNDSVELEGFLACDNTFTAKRAQFHGHQRDMMYHNNTYRSNLQTLVCRGQDKAGTISDSHRNQDIQLWSRRYSRTSADFCPLCFSLNWDNFFFAFAYAGVVEW